MLAEVARRIYLVRGQNVMLDSDLAELYGVETRTLNQAVKRNAVKRNAVKRNSERFPEDFMFQFDVQEDELLRSQSVIASTSKAKQRYRSCVFTEQGVAVLSSVLRSERAVQVNIAIMRAFVSLRGLLTQDSDLVRRILHLEGKYDRQFAAVFEAIRQMIEAPPADEVPERRMGFRKSQEENEP